MAGSSKEMKKHEKKVKRPEDIPESSSTHLTGAPTGRRKMQRENSPRLDAAFQMETLVRGEQCRHRSLPIPSAHSGTRTVGKEL